MSKTVSRRSFLARAAAGIVGGNVLSLRRARTAASAGRVVGANDTVRIGLIGCGRRGSQWMDVLTRPTGAGEKVSLVAVCDIYEPHKVRAQSRTGAPVHHRWQNLVSREDLDAVVIATPDHWHTPMAIAAMTAGKDVYCETPMARTVAEARAFRDCAVATGRVVQIGATETSEEQWQVARDLIAQGKIGKVRWAQPAPPLPPPLLPRDRTTVVRPEDVDWVAFQGDAPEQPFSPERFTDWRWFWDYSDGIAAEVFYAKLAALLIALGPEFPARVSAAGGIYQHNTRETPDMFVMNAEYAAGHTIVLTSSTAKDRRPSGVIRGETGAIYCEAGQMLLVSEKESAVSFAHQPAQRSHAPASYERLGAHATDWLECIRTRRPCACNPDIACRATAAIAMAVEAYRQRKTFLWDADREQAVVSPPRAPV